MDLPKLEEKIPELLYEARGCEAISEAIMNVKNEYGHTYQVKIIVTREEDDIDPTTSFPDMKVEDGYLIEDLD